MRGRLESWLKLPEPLLKPYLPRALFNKAHDLRLFALVLEFFHGAIPIANSRSILNSYRVSKHDSFNNK